MAKVMDLQALSPAFLQQVPHAPGVYLMESKAGLVLYVGKARDLRKRLASYVRYVGEGQTKTGMLLAKVARVQTILTNTEKEAFLLEGALIKKHRPKYNVILRDDKNYPLLKVTLDETWPRLVVTRRRIKDKARYFGPFASAGAMRETLNCLKAAFPLRHCKGRELQKRSRPCLNYQMGRCQAPCAGQADSAQYWEAVHSILLVLEGKDRQLFKEIEEKMAQAAAAERFEEAALYRDRLQALGKTLEKQIMVASHHRDQDVFGIARQDTAVALSILLVRNGAVNGVRSYYLREPAGEDAEVLSQAVKRFYGEDRPIPGEILLPVEIEDLPLLADWLTEQSGHRVWFRVPKRGDNLNLLQMAWSNARQVHADQERKSAAWESLSTQLQTELQLSRPPERIECCDISNISGQQAVGALISFTGGGKNSAGYRHYKIRLTQGPDDYAMMREVLERRLRRGIENNDLPDLLLLDGGRGQLNVAVAVVRDLGLANALDLASIAKEREEEGEKVFRPGRKNPLRLARHSPVLLYLMRLRDEAHRYGITFHRKWRQKQGLLSQLDTIPGIGPARRKLLLTTFGSVKGVEEASVHELAGLPGIGSELARLIWEHLHQP